MSVLDDKTRLLHIRDSALKVSSFISDESRESLDQDEKLQLALVRLIEIIGEAAAQITPELKQEYPSIPWAAITGMRNRLIHAYFNVDLDIVWQTAVISVPQILEDVLKILAEKFNN